MEINRVNTPQVVGIELKKQPEKIKDTGLKEDKFEKNLTPDVVMDEISKIKGGANTPKFANKMVLDQIKKSLDDDPKKCVFAQKLAPQDNISPLGLRNILTLSNDTLKDVTEILTKKNHKDELKFATTSEAADITHMIPENLQKVKDLMDTPLTGKNIIKITQEQAKIDTKKLAAEAKDMANTVGEDNIDEMIFARDKFSKGDYTLTASKEGKFLSPTSEKVSYSKTYEEVLDKDMNRYSIETSDGYSTHNKNYEIKKVKDLRNNTTAKTRYELNEKGRPVVTNEVRLVKDNDGKVLKTEYTEPSDIKGVYNIKQVMPNGEVKQVSMGKIDKKTGITTIKKDMTSPLGVRTEYLYEDDPQGNRILDYKITDKNGKVLLNNSESFEVVNDKKFISSKNGHKYEMTVDDDGMGLTVKDLEKPTRTVRFDSKTDISGMQEPIMNVLKQMPGEELFKLKQTTNKLVGIENVLESYSQTKLESRSINTGNDLFIILHELGHACDLKDVDMMFERTTAGNAIFYDKTFNAIFDKEKDAFNKAYPDAQRNHIAYFINHETHYGGEVGGKRETIAESNALLTTAKSHEVLGIRSQYLQQNFPETIAYLDKKLAEAPSHPIEYMEPNRPDGW